MALTYVALATVTVGAGGAASMSFTNIPGTYTDLAVKTTFRGNGDVLLFLNSATFGTNGGIRLNGDGATPGSNPASNGFISDAQYASFTANVFGSLDIYIPNYTSTSNKSVTVDAITENNATTAYMNMVTALFTSSVAITSLSLTASGGNTFAQNSTATLYGIKNTV